MLTLLTSHCTYGIQKRLFVFVFVGILCIHAIYVCCSFPKGLNEIGSLLRIVVSCRKIPVITGCCPIFLLPWISPLVQVGRRLEIIPYPIYMPAHRTGEPRSSRRMNNLGSISSLLNNGSFNVKVSDHDHQGFGKFGFYFFLPQVHF